MVGAELRVGPSDKGEHAEKGEHIGSPLRNNGRDVQMVGADLRVGPDEIGEHDDAGAHAE